MRDVEQVQPHRIQRRLNQQDHDAHNGPGGEDGRSGQHRIISGIPNRILQRYPALTPAVNPLDDPLDQAADQDCG